MKPVCPSGFCLSGQRDNKISITQFSSLDTYLQFHQVTERSFHSLYSLGSVECHKLVGHSFFTDDYLECYTYVYITHPDTAYYFHIYICIYIPAWARQTCKLSPIPASNRSGSFLVVTYDRQGFPYPSTFFVSLSGTTRTKPVGAKRLPVDAITYFFVSKTSELYWRQVELIKETENGGVFGSAYTFVGGSRFLSKWASNRWH